ncbi:MAG: hypothetical protein HYT80_09755 [Euryarchaeota archaeon]|nr:hypothetical protein [Euryarchaeota archaeon]
MGRVRALPLALLVSTMAFSACLEEAKEKVDDLLPDLPPVRPQVPADLVDPLVLNHDHASAKLHNLAYDMKLLAHHPLGGNLAKSSGAHALDIQAGYLFVAAYGASVDVDGGLYIFDLKNPEKPNLVGQLRLPGNLGGDRSMEATDDGNWVALGTEPFDCAGHLNPFAPGLFLIDTRDKTRPLVADFLPGTVHSVTVHRVKNVDYVFSAGTTVVESGNIYRISVSPTRSQLLTVGRVSISHDSVAYDDPVLGIPLLYATAGGFSVYDISDPRSPKQVGKWAPPGDEGKGHYSHQMAVDWVEGRRVVVYESEDWGTAVSPVWIVDATDLGAMEKLGMWTNPGQKAAGAGESTELIYSTHNPRIESGILYLSHYHGGVWLVNVSTLRQAEAPETMGYYLPHNDNGGFVPRSGEGAYPKPNICQFDLDDVPNVFDVEVQNGIVYAADVHTGVYTLRYDDSIGQVKP